MKAKKYFSVLLFLAGTLFFSACSLDGEDPKPETHTIDTRLYGVWRFYYSGNYEEIIVDRDGGTQPGSLGLFTFGGFNVVTNDYTPMFKGDIMYASAFSADSGIIIIEYLPGWENRWMNLDPPWSKNPNGYMFYGIYYINITNGGNRVFFACTNDQDNNYGPTETATLEQAIAKFTEGNMPNLLDLSVGDPLDRYTP
jgi:hypothetical protein